MNQESPDGIRAAVFDIGGVLLDWNPRYLYEKLIPDEEEREFFLGNICTDAWNLEQDRGRGLEEAALFLIDRHPEEESLIRAFYDRWDEMIRDAIWETVRIMDGIRAQGYPVYSITNFSEDCFAKACRRFPFLETFDGIVMSAREKIVKPDPQIYAILLERYALNPDALVFIDDKPENVRAAQAIGMRGIVFQSAQQCAEDLAEIAPNMTVGNCGVRNTGA